MPENGTWRLDRLGVESKILHPQTLNSSTQTPQQTPQKNHKNLETHTPNSHNIPHIPSYKQKRSR